MAVKVLPEADPAAGKALQCAGQAARAREHFVAFRQAIERNIAAGPDRISDHMLIDMVNIRLGEKTLTVYTEEQLADTDPDFDPIRNDPRFEGIKRRTLKLGDG